MAPGLPRTRAVCRRAAKEAVGNVPVMENGKLNLGVCRYSNNSCIFYLGDLMAIERERETHIITR